MLQWHHSQQDLCSSSDELCELKLYEVKTSLMNETWKPNAASQPFLLHWLHFHLNCSRLLSSCSVCLQRTDVLNTFKNQLLPPDFWKGTYCKCIELMSDQLWVLPDSAVIFTPTGQSQIKMFDSLPSVVYLSQNIRVNEPYISKVENLKSEHSWENHVIKGQTVFLSK